MPDAVPLDRDPGPAAAGPFPGVHGILAGRFHIEARLGAGGMGEVFRARDATLRRLVAIKRMQHAATETDRKRFLHEGQRASALNHPGIAAIYDVFAEDGEVYLVMEYIEGETLRARLARPIAQQEFERIATESAAALAAAHDKGILHRDIKPENIMLTASGAGAASQVKLLDFGLAQQATDETGLLETATALTMHNQLAGTPQYMAPEVLNGDPADRRSDIFALGVVYYEMLSGCHPFASPTLTAMIGRVLHQPPRPLDPAVPPPLATIVNRALAKSPADRYQDAHQIVRDLANPALMQPHVLQSATSAQLSANAPSTRRRFAVLGLVCLASAVLIGAAIYLFKRSHPQLSAASSAPVAVTPGTLAVLPPIVADASDAKLVLFGRGLAESLAQRLSDLSVNHDVTVLSARQLSDKKVSTLADAVHELGATSALALRLTRQGDLVHAAYTVEQPAKSPQPHVIAAGIVTAPVTDMFAIESQLAAATAAALHIGLRTDEQRALAAQGTTFPEAYQYFLQGRGYLLEATKPESIRSAQTMFKEALRIDPRYGASQAGLGESWVYDYELTHHAQTIQDARKACDQAVAMGNAGAEGHMCLGMLAHDTGNAAEAAVEFQKALQLEPASEQASIGLAKAYEQLNQLEKAEEVYKQAIALRPNYWRGYDQLGGFYFANADYAKAAQMFRTAAEKDPQSFRSYSNLGAALMSQEKDTEAVEVITKSIALRPTADGYGNLGVALFRLRRFSEATQAFSQSIQLSPNAYDKWSSRADSEYYGGNHLQAAGDYRKAIELAVVQLETSPNDATILGDLASYHSALGDEPHAIEFLNRSLAVNHTDKELMFNAAVVYNQLHQTGPALEWLAKALAAGYAPSVVAKAPALDSLHTNPRYQQLMQSPQQKP